ncbi:MAG: thiamine-monophosphate kinase [Nitrospirae bacterium]|nr:MAG: thiamine-monophosphate kinase [Nitrospirota bacterium]
MRLSDIGELSLLETIRRRFTRKSGGVIVGIGDDAAVIKPQDKKLLITTDMMVERVHFDLNFTTPYQLGFKLVSVNVSDIYAMGGVPQYLLLDIAMNKTTEEAFVDSFFDGIQDAIKLYGISLIGGDISSSKKDMVAAASLIGHAENPVKRSGAKPGDKIYVTGNLGDSAGGLEVLKRIKKTVPIENTPSPSLPPRGGGMGGGDNSKLQIIISKLSKSGLTWNTIVPLLKRHLMPIARNPIGFVKYATAMIDLSDGLFIDLSRLCNESRVGARIYMKQIPISSQMKKVSSVLGLNPFNLAASGGEDYELLFTAPPDYKPRAMSHELKITCIGEITKKDRVVVDETGRESILKTAGYQHFGIKRQT